MDMRFLFPYEYVKKDSSVIIYGLGVCGTAYIDQIELTNYCNIIAVTDTYCSSTYRDYEQSTPEQLVERSDYDYIIIAITKYPAAIEVYKRLIQYGIDKRKIITPLYRSGGVGLNTSNKKNNERIRILFNMTGGLGDAVMELCFYERIIELAPSVLIDIYGEPFCNCIYDGKRNIGRIIDYNTEKINADDYDISLQASWGITVHKIDETRVKALAPDLFECILKTRIDMRKGESLITRLRRAQILGKNKFWLMGRGDIWRLSQDRIIVDLKKEYYKVYTNLKLTKYITINCGADMRRVRADQYPTKVWPISHFNKFICLFKKKYKDIEVIQLGADDQRRISGADRSIMGESIETVKHILKNSILHIDDEGGLVHLATALNTKCLVMFGPTPLEILGYPQNINISAQKCLGCFAYVSDWNANCMLGDKQTRCMSAILPQLVFEKASEYIESI